MELQHLKDAMSRCERERVFELIHQGISEKLDPYMILDAMTEGMSILGENFASGEAFIPELIRAGDIFKSTMETLKPHMEAGKGIQYKGKVVLCTVQGDLHDVGKNLVGSVLAMAGFEVIDLGKDVPVEDIILAVNQEKPDVVGLSALLTTTMFNQRRFIEVLKAENLRDEVKVIVGGAPTTQEWADEIGADAHGRDAIDGKDKIAAMLGK